jgi:type I restriction enzyme S subunit
MKQGWEIKKLEEVCEELFAGGDVPKENSSKFETDNFQIPIFSNGEKNKGLYGFTNVARVTKPSITIAARGTIGYSEIREEPFYPAIRLIVVIPKTEILDLFFLKYVFSGIDFNHSGSSIPQLTIPMIKGYPVPLPPLPEQHRIVSILDKAFAAIATAKANAEQNLKNAKELFESYLQGVFEKKGEGWEEKELMEICEQITDGSHFSPKSSDDDEYPYITVRDIDDDIIDFDNCKNICKKDFKLLMKNGCKPNLGDLLFSKDGTVGKVSLVDFEKDFVVLSSLAIIRPKSKIITSSLLKYILKNPLFLQTAVGMKTGVAIRRIILKNLKLIDVSFPKSLKDQNNIVQKLDALSAETKKLEAIYQQKSVDLEELKKSVLQKAFNGEL